MNQLDNLALVAEYPWRFGGSQRLLATLAKYWEKPIYLLPPVTSSAKIWNTEPIIAVPFEPIIFSVVVDGQKPQILPGKKHIKFCHSESTIKKYWDDPVLKSVKFITHRERVADFYSDKGLAITNISSGYIPFDAQEPENEVILKQNTCSIISRISQDKFPLALAEELTKLPFRTVILGSREDNSHVKTIEQILSSGSAQLLPQDLPEGFSETNKMQSLHQSRILVHYSGGNLKDHLEYSILDGLATGNIPLCITHDPLQFSIIEKEKMGRVIQNISELACTAKEIFTNYESYLINSNKFMHSFMLEQVELRKRWTYHLTSEIAQLLT